MWGDIIEVWKDIEGYEGLYQVSNLGRVRGLDRMVFNKRGSKTIVNGRILKQKTDRYGYKCVCLSKDSKSKHFAVHRLVAQAFIPNPENKPTVNHINEIKDDNRVDNLEWMTVAENNQYGTRNQRMGKTQQRAVIQYTLSNDYIAKYESIQEASIKTNMSEAAIINICKGRQKHPKRYIWRYVNDRT